MQVSLTDWKAIDAMQDRDIDLSDLPEVSTEKFARATVRQRLKLIPKKAQIILKLDVDVLEWFQNQGESYQERSMPC